MNSGEMAGSLALLFWLACGALVSAQGVGPDSSAGEIAEIIDDSTRHLDERLEAIRVLSGYGEEAIPFAHVLLEVLLEAPSSDLRSAAAVALRELGPIGCGVVPALTQALRTPHPTVRLRSAEAFLNLEIAAQGERAVGNLARMAYRDDRVENRAAAFASLEAIASKPPIVQRLLRRGLLAPGIPDRTPYIRLAVATEASEAPVVEALARSLDQTSGAVRFATIDALGRLGRGHPCAFEALEGCLLGPGRTVRIACMDSILHWGPEASQFLPALDFLVLVDDPQVRDAAKAVRAEILMGLSTGKP